MRLIRGGVFIVAERGPYSNKPRPALLIQAEALEDHTSLQFCMISSDAEARTDAFFRIPVEPTEANGLNVTSTIMVDKIVTIRREKLGQRCGVLEEAVMGDVNAALVAFQGLI